MIKYGTNNIGKIYFGSNLIGKAYFGSNLVYSSGSGPGPGPQPTSIAYIRGGADGSYIDTGITADNTTRVVLWARNLNPAPTSNDWSHVFGSRNASANKSFMLVMPNAQRIGLLALEYGNTYAAYSSDTFKYLSGYHKYELYDGDILVDDTVIASATKATFSNSNNIYLFSVNTNGTSEPCQRPIDIHACKIYKAGVLVRDFTAVNTPSVGLFDSVSNTLFTNAGSGNFTYGTFNSNAYTPLEYIECDARQWFDTGLYGSYSLPFVTKFRLTGPTARWFSLLGARTTNSSGRYDLSFGDASIANCYVACGYNTSPCELVTNNVVKTGIDLIVTKNNNVFSAYENGTLLRTVNGSTNTSFQTTYTLAVGTYNAAGTINSSEAYYGRIYYIGFGDQMNLVPAKSGTTVGLYDTYNDVFYPSISGTAFVAGPEL